MKLSDVFERVYVLNLPTRPDRRLSITRELDSVGMPFAPGKVEIFSGIRPTDPCNFQNVGRRGCFLSHLGILKQAKKDRLANVLIIEDDLSFTKLFKSEQADLVKQMGYLEWDMIHFGFAPYEGWNYSNYSDQPVESSDNCHIKFMRNRKFIIGCHFYGVNSSVFDPLVHRFEAIHDGPPGDPEIGPMSVDGTYNIYRKKHPDFRSYLAIPSLGHQLASRSDIMPKIWDRTPLLQPLLNIARPVKKRLVKAFQ